MDDSTNVLSSVGENGKIIKPNTLCNLNKSTRFDELFEKTVGNDHTSESVNVEVECSVSDGKSTNPVIVNLSNEMSVCVEFGLKYVKFCVLKLRPEIPSCSTTGACVESKICSLSILPSYGTVGSMIPRYLFCLFLCTAVPPAGFSIYIFINATVTFIGTSGHSVGQMS